MSKASAAILMKQFKELTDPKKGARTFHIQLEDDDIYKWAVCVMITDDSSPYYGGYFRAQMTFPEDYPYSPPKFRFSPAIWHPNVYSDGALCISILHSSGDETNTEPDAETWSPAQSVESVLISIVSLLADPNVNSAANVDAALMWRKDRTEYNKRVAQDVAASRANIPKDFTMPTENDAYVSAKSYRPDDDVVDENFWLEDDNEDLEETDEEMRSSEDYDEEEEEEEEEGEEEEDSS